MFVQLNMLGMFKGKFFQKMLKNRCKNLKEEENGFGIYSNFYCL